jgi:ABC-type sugar transport system permease subunit
MNTFTYVYVLTGGGPIRLTEVLGVYIYNMAFQSFKFGMASAAVVLVFLISAGLSLAYLRVLRASDA